MSYKTLDDMRVAMKLWDKKLSHLDDEMLHYILHRASSIIESREYEQSTEN